MQVLGVALQQTRNKCSKLVVQDKDMDLSLLGFLLCHCSLSALCPSTSCPLYHTHPLFPPCIPSTLNTKKLSSIRLGFHKSSGLARRWAIIVPGAIFYGYGSGITYGDPAVVSTVSPCLHPSWSS